MGSSTASICEHPPQDQPPIGGPERCQSLPNPVTSPHQCEGVGTFKEEN